MKKDITIAILAVVAIFAIVYGLSTMRPSTTPSASTSVPQESRKSGEGAVVMRVNGEAVTEREFGYFVASLPEQMQSFFNNPAGRRQMGEQYVRMKVLAQEAQRLGADKDPDVTARVKFGETNVAVEYALQKIGNPTEAQLRAEYEKNKAKFTATNLRHVLVAYQGSRVQSVHGPALSPDQAAQKAQKIVAALRAGGDFAAIAKRESDDAGTAGQGGVIGSIPRGALPPDMERVVDTLQPGQISDPVRSEFGVHVIRVDGRRPQSFEEVKAALKQQLQMGTVNETVARLQKSARVELDPKFFPGPGPAPRP